MTTTDSPSDTVRTAPPGLWSQLRPLVLRLHFYAGIFVAPFLLVVALTGLAYVFSPQLSDLLYRDQLFASDPAAPARPLDDQVAAAVAGQPEGTLSSVIVPTDPTRTTSVVFDVEGLAPDVQRTVYVDPSTAQVRGALGHLVRLPAAADHARRAAPAPAARRTRPALLGDGRQLAAGAGHRRAGAVDRPPPPRAAGWAALLLPTAVRPPGRARIRSWHAVTALWLTIGLAFISVTGLTWSTHAGRTLPGGGDRAAGTHPGAARPRPCRSARASRPSCRGRGRPGPRRRAAGPARGDGAGRAGRRATRWPRTPTAGPCSGTPWPSTPTPATIVETVAWADFPPLAKLTTIGISAHMGLLFGLPNQLLLAGLAIGLLCVLFWGYRMAWLRRPTRAGAWLGRSRPARRPARAEPAGRVRGGAARGGRRMADAGVRGDPARLPAGRRRARDPGGPPGSRSPTGRAVDRSRVAGRRVRAAQPRGRGRDGGGRAGSPRGPLTVPGARRDVAGHGRDVRAVGRPGPGPGRRGALRRDRRLVRGPPAAPRRAGPRTTPCTWSSGPPR